MPPTEPRTASSRRIVVGLLGEDQEYQRLQAQAALDAARRAHLPIEILYAEHNAVLQIQQLYKVIHAPEPERPLAIVVETVVGEGLARVARAATAAGIGWVLVNQSAGYIAELRSAYPALAIGMLGNDHDAMGQMQARQFRLLARSKPGTVLYVQGPPDTTAAQLRLAGARAGLAGSDLTLKVITGQWTEASGEAAMKGWLRLNISEQEAPILIGCQNDSMAVGVARAISVSPHKASLERIPMTGCDGLPDGGQKLVQLGRLAATIVMAPVAGVAVEALLSAVYGRAPLPLQQLLPPTSYPAEAELSTRRA
jgi:ABC-type sugar transport system substrate-binding protein